jgi:peptide/nickel transport system permease protein
MVGSPREPGTPVSNVTLALNHALSRNARLREVVAPVARAAADRPLLTVATLTLFLLVLAALMGPVLRPLDPNQIDLLSGLQAPSAAHPMGTDEFGRDILARFMRGAQISLLVGTVVIVIGAICGGTIGILAGVFGGWRDGLLMRIMDSVLAFPPLILAMAVTVGLGTGIVTGAIGITIASIPWYARVVRSEVLRLRTLPFVEAAVALGARRRWVVFQHVVPAILPTLVVQAAAAFGYSILALAALGFVGLGAQIPTPEWGAMITDGLQYTLTGQWWIDVFPGLGLLLAATAANVIADGFRDMLDPRGHYARV